MGYAKTIPQCPASGAIPLLIAPADSAHAFHARRRGRIVDAKESFDASDDAADRRGNNGADRARDAIAFIRALREAAGKTALGLSRDRSRHGGRDDACAQQCRSHETSPLFLFDSVRRQPRLAFQ
jgi:hypothetical protein